MNLRVVVLSGLAAIALTGLVLLVVSYGLGGLFHWAHSLLPGEALAVRICLAAVVTGAFISALVVRRRRAAAVA